MKKKERLANATAATALAARCAVNLSPPRPPHQSCMLILHLFTSLIKEFRRSRRARSTLEWRAALVFLPARRGGGRGDCRGGRAGPLQPAGEEDGASPGGVALGAPATAPAMAAAAGDRPASAVSSARRASISRAKAAESTSAGGCIWEAGKKKGFTRRERQGFT
jgi:hypothetical protein